MNYLRPFCSKTTGTNSLFKRIHAVPNPRHFSKTICKKNKDDGIQDLIHDDFGQKDPSFFTDKNNQWHRDEINDLVDYNPNAYFNEVHLTGKITLPIYQFQNSNTGEVLGRNIVISVNDNNNIHPSINSWIQLAAFGKMGEFIEKDMKKGDTVMCIARLFQKKNRNTELILKHISKVDEQIAQSDDSEAIL